MSVEKVLTCSGCSACSSACPQNAIDMEENVEGFLYPKVNKKICNQCGICEKACPLSTESWRQVRMKEQDIYAAWNKHQKTRVLSSSGGVFTALAMGVLEKDGIVFGAGYNEKADIVHKAVYNLDNLSELRGSKYVQSYIGKTYLKVKELLGKKRKILFSGTPCQIAGLYCFLGGDDENLLTCDLVCHGIPSPKFYRKYLKYEEKRNNAKIKQIFFRDKRYGWNRFEIVIDFIQRKSKREAAKDNPFMIAFFKNICLRSSCHSCQFKKIPCVADITLGDFWGIGSYDSKLDDDKGTSLVLVNSEKGKKLWSKCKNMISFKQCPFEYIENNQMLFQSTKPHEKRKQFFSDLNNCVFEMLIDIYLKPRTTIRIYKSWLKNNLVRLCKKLKNVICIY